MARGIPIMILKVPPKDRTGRQLFIILNIYMKLLILLLNVGSKMVFKISSDLGYVERGDSVRYS